jgi:hypothetical protein
MSLPKYNDKAIFVVLCVVVIMLAFESSLVKNYNLVGSAPVWLFLIIGLAFIVGQYFIFEYTEHVFSQQESKRSDLIIRKTVRIVQYLLSGAIVTIFIQIVLTGHYSSLILTLVIGISYGSAVFMLATLGRRFLLWFRSNRAGVVLMYGVAAIALIANALFALLFVTDILLETPSAIGPNSQALYYYPIPGSIEFILNSTYSIFSVVSFVLTWTATAWLLHTYSRKIGKIKFWIVLSLPLVYFLSQFPSFSLNLFSPLLDSDPIFYGIVLSVVFNISKLAGGILFAVAFWTIAKTLPGGSIVRNYLIIAAIGFLLLFVADQGVVLVTTPYPPLGLASISYMGIGSYLIFMGIYSSAVAASADSKIRRSIRDYAVTELRLVDSIGTAQMEIEIKKRVISITKKSQSLTAEETGFQPSLTDDDLRSYMDQVLDEIEDIRKKRFK